ncbi:MAG TPA: PASTA domain-containing protein, partial [Solirubrobacteraceae bacterium]|nr:PASTA domain-containing protein [Solirubrobacteraceae bacterium]
PPAGKTIKAGSQVTLYISSGPATKKVPDVKGETQTAATADLTKAGFSVNTSNKATSSAPAGTVVSQSPAAGTTQPKGSTVTIVLATAPATATVPSVVGDPTSGAVSALTNAGFKVKQQTQTVDKQSKDGTVVHQSPGANSTAKKGSTVTITIGKYVPSSSSSSSSTSSSTTSTSSSSTTTTSSTPAAGSPTP